MLFKGVKAFIKTNQLVFLDWHHGHAMDAYISTSIIIHTECSYFILRKVIKSPLAHQTWDHKVFMSHRESSCNCCIITFTFRKPHFDIGSQTSPFWHKYPYLNTWWESASAMDVFREWKVPTSWDSILKGLSDICCGPRCWCFPSFLILSVLCCTR